MCCMILHCIEHLCPHSFCLCWRKFIIPLNPNAYRDFSRLLKAILIGLSSFCGKFLCSKILVFADVMVGTLPVLLVFLSASQSSFFSPSFFRPALLAFGPIVSSPPSSSLLEPCRFTPPIAGFALKCGEDPVGRFGRGS